MVGSLLRTSTPFNYWQCMEKYGIKRFQGRAWAEFAAQNNFKNRLLSIVSNVASCNVWVKGARERHSSRGAIYGVRLSWAEALDLGFRRCWGANQTGSPLGISKPYVFKRIRRKLPSQKRTCRGAKCTKYVKLEKQARARHALYGRLGLFKSWFLA